MAGRESERRNLTKADMRKKKWREKVKKLL